MKGRFGKNVDYIGHVEYKETVALHMDALRRQFTRSLEFHINTS